MVEAVIQASYLVFLDSDFRVYEVVLAGTVTAANEQNRKQENKMGGWDTVIPDQQSNTIYKTGNTKTPAY